jgi:hypothetical protein
MKKYIITDRDDFRLRVLASDCFKPEDSISLDFVREEFDEKGQLLRTSTYNFFLNTEEIEHLGGCLLSIAKDHQ